jgi:hypothetical protein
MIDFTTAQPLGEAVENISTRTPIGSTLNSAEWALLPPEIRMRALFSSRVEEERYLVSMQDKLEQRVRLGRNEGTLMERSRFIAEMQDDLKQFGYEPDPRKRGSIQDISSAGRLGLIWDMNLAQAEGYAAWKMGMDPDMLDAAPAQELIRVANRIEKRPWPAIWREHGGKFYGEPHPDFPDAPGRMMALKTDPIWEAISEFGSPWPPFRWGSGVGLRNVRRREAEKLGVLAEGATVKPLDYPFNHSVEASLKGIPESGRKAIENDLQGEVEIEGDVIRLRPQQAFALSKQGKSKAEILKQQALNTEDQPASAGGYTLSDFIKINLLGRIMKNATATQIYDAIKLVESVHSVPALQEMALKIKRLSGGVAGRFSAKNNRGLFEIHPEAYSLKMTTWHEIGHMMDRLVLQGPGKRMYASWGQPSVDALMQVITHTTAYQRLLVRAAGNGDFYWVARHEAFARAYAQFIAAETNDPDAKEYLRKVRMGEYEKDEIWKDTQWTGMDFRPIRSAFRKLLERSNLILPEP